MACVQSVIFDLDGTLIDSSTSVLASYKAAFDRVGCEPVCALTPAIIGPPLQPTLQMLSGSSDPQLLNALAAQFIEYYDSTGYKGTVAFEGSHLFLRELVASGVGLFIATNKRIAPTKLIVKHLGWSRLFQGVYALDSWRDVLPAKEHVIRQIIGLHDLNPYLALYVGDRDDDRIAAQHAGIPFFLVPWGYGVPSISAIRSSQRDFLDWRLLRERTIGK